MKNLIDLQDQTAIQRKEIEEVRGKKYNSIEEYKKNLYAVKLQAVDCLGQQQTQRLSDCL